MDEWKGKINSLQTNGTPYRPRWSPQYINNGSLLIAFQNGSLNFSLLKLKKIWNKPHVSLVSSLSPLLILFSLFFSTALVPFSITPLSEKKNNPFIKQKSRVLKSQQT